MMITPAHLQAGTVHQGTGGTIVMVADPATYIVQDSISEYIAVGDSILDFYLFDRALLMRHVDGWCLLIRPPTARPLTRRERFRLYLHSRISRSQKRFEGHRR